jgi:hypothetical protein
LRVRIESCKLKMGGGAVRECHARWVRETAERESKNGDQVALRVEAVRAVLGWAGLGLRLAG